LEKNNGLTKNVIEYNIDNNYLIFFRKNRFDFLILKKILSL